MLLVDFQIRIHSMVANHWFKAGMATIHCNVQHIDWINALVQSICSCWTLLKEAQWAGISRWADVEGESLELVSLNCSSGATPHPPPTLLPQLWCPASQMSLFGTVGVCPIGYSGRGGGISSISGCYSGLTEKVWSVLE